MSKEFTMTARVFRGSLIPFFAFLALPLLLTAQNKGKNAAPDSSRPSYEAPQPAAESLDLAMYARIRDEAIAHTHVMEYASGLMDGIGPRLTGSPNLKRANEWTRDQFTAMGCPHPPLEAGGGVGWAGRQLNTWVRMSA